MRSSDEEDDVIAWAVRTSDPAFDDWQAFAAWLDGDPGRNLAYDRAMVAVVDAVAVLGQRPATVGPGPRAAVAHRRAAPRTRRRTAWAGGGLALAAGVAGVLLIGRPPTSPSTFSIEAPAGAPRVVALTDGTSIALAGGGRLSLDRARPRSATLARGRAMFMVRHDASAPFRVLAGRHEILDAGTSFDVALHPGGAEIGVAEGLVIVDPDRMATTLEPGDRMRLHDGMAPKVVRVSPAEIGQWRNERMSYRDAALPSVVADLAAATGHPVALDAALAGRRFTGTLSPATLRGRPEELATLLDVRVLSDGRGWKLLPR